MSCTWCGQPGHYTPRCTATSSEQSRRELRHQKREAIARRKRERYGKLKAACLVVEDGDEVRASEELFS